MLEEKYYCGLSRSKSTLLIRSAALGVQYSFWGYTTLCIHSHELQKQTNETVLE